SSEFSEHFARHAGSFSIQGPWRALNFRQLLHRKEYPTAEYCLKRRLNRPSGVRFDLLDAGLKAMGVGGTVYFCLTEGLRSPNRRRTGDVVP
ncbi:hypothetical protein, partial [Verrucomicrobium sp. BvORR034]|uniref:hypothetical protein n=1 Tax=Verrucomicrobium sp. BvORR034 TaxID=1396418 RepID=UPI002240F1D6